MSVLIGIIGLIFFGILVAVANRALAQRVQEKRQELEAAEHAAKQSAKRQ